MDEVPGTGPRTPAEPAKTRVAGRTLLWAMAAVVVAFLAGFLWQYMEASSVRSELEATEQQLRVARLRVQLAQAGIAAQGGDFESARVQMSELFTRLEEAGATLPEPVAALAQDFLTVRDEVITGLSRSNPHYAEVLFGMLDRLRAATEPGATPVAPSGGATSDSAAPGAPGEDPAGAAGDTGG